MTAAVTHGQQTVWLLREQAGAWFSRAGGTTACAATEQAIVNALAREGGMARMEQKDGQKRDAPLLSRITYHAAFPPPNITTPSCALIASRWHFDSE